MRMEMTEMLSKLQAYHALRLQDWKVRKLRLVGLEIGHVGRTGGLADMPVSDILPVLV